MARAVGNPQTVQCEPVAEIGCSQIGQLDGTDLSQTDLETVSACLKSIREESTSSYRVSARGGGPIRRRSMRRGKVSHRKRSARQRA